MGLICPGRKNNPCKSPQINDVIECDVCAKWHHHNSVVTLRLSDGTGQQKVVSDNQNHYYYNDTLPDRTTQNLASEFKNFQLFQYF